MELEALAELGVLGRRLGPKRLQFGLGLLLDRRLGHDRPGEPVGHVEGAVDQVAQVVRQVAVVADEEQFPREVAVLPDVHLADQEIAEGVGAKLGDEVEGVQGVARALGHLLPALQPPPVNQKALRERYSGRLEHDGPVDGVRRDEDVLADHVPVGGPPLALLRRGVVVQKRVEPDVCHVARVKGKGDPPLQPLPGTRDAQVVQGLLQEFKDLLLAVLGEDEVRVCRQEVDQPVLVHLQLEEVVRLDDLGHLAVELRPGAVRIAVLLLQELLLASAVEPTVLAQVDVSLVVQRLEDLGDDRLVAALGRADEIVVRNRQLRQERLELRAHLVGKRLRINALALGALLHLLAVLVGARQEMDFVTHQAPIAGNNVRQHFLIGMAQVRRTVHVIDRGGDVEPRHGRDSHIQKGVNVQSFEEASRGPASP